MLKSMLESYVIAGLSNDNVPPCQWLMVPRFIPIENKWKQQGIIGMVHLGDKIYFVMQYKSNAIHMHPFHNSKIAVDIT